MRKSEGFTLIELMIVIAIIAIIAAIAIPGLLSSQRASNERNASASLKTIASAQADFRGNDRDGNKIQDFWTADVSGLYGVIPVSSTEMVKLIEISVAGADFACAGTAAVGASGHTEVNRNNYSVAAPKAGYWYQRMLIDEAGADYQVNTNGITTAPSTLSTVSLWNHSKFGFYAFPDSFSAGRNVFFINEGNTIFKRTMNGPVKGAAVTPTSTGVTLSIGTSALVGAQVAENWPDDTTLKAEYSKLD